MGTVLRTEPRVGNAQKLVQKWAAQNKLLIQFIVHILDDFFIVNKTKALCDRDLQLFVAHLKELGIPVATEKTFLGAQVMSFKGIEIDSVRRQTRLPKDKIDRCVSKLTEVIDKKRIRLKELRVLLGHLAFACSVIVPGRAFLRRLYDLTIRVSNEYQFIYITKEARADMLVWLEFLRVFNGKNFFFTDTWLSSASLNFDIAAVPGIGWGLTFKAKWAAGLWGDLLNSENDRVFLKLYPILLVIHMWGRQLSNNTVKFYCNDFELVQVLKHQTSKSPRVMILVRKLVLKCLFLNISLKAEFNMHQQTGLAHLLSYNRLSEFQKLMPPGLERQQTIIPSAYQLRSWLLE